MVSRIGLPLSIVSMKARVSMLASIRSAIRLRMLARYAGEVPFQLMRGGVRRVERLVHVLVGGAGHLAQRLPGDRGRIDEVLPAGRRDVLPGDPVVVAGADGDRGLEAGGRLGKGGEGGLPGCGTHVNAPCVRELAQDSVRYMRRG